MGYIRHNAIVITTWSEANIAAAADKAAELGLQVLGPAPSVINGYSSLMICPDGSKEGWDDSDIGDSKRAAFRAWLDAQRYDDGSSNFEWAEIAYGSDDAAAAVTHSAWKVSNFKVSGAQPALWRSFRSTVKLGIGEEKCLKAKPLPYT